MGAAITALMTLPGTSNAADQQEAAPAPSGPPPPSQDVEVASSSASNSITGQLQPFMDDALTSSAPPLQQQQQGKPADTASTPPTPPSSAGETSPGSVSTPQEGAPPPSSPSTAPVDGGAATAPMQGVPEGQGSSTTSTLTSRQLDVVAEACGADCTFSYPYTTASVPPNLRLRQYWLILLRQRPQAWSNIALLISRAEFGTLSSSVNLGPMSILRTAALYVPWALLQLNAMSAATEARKAYVAFDDHVVDLQRVAGQAQDGTANAEQVQQAFFLMSASFDVLLGAVPVQYVKA